MKVRLKRKIYPLFTLILAIVCCTVCLTACNTGDDESNGEGKTVGRIVESTGERVVIFVEEANGETTLFEVMEALSEGGDFTYELSGTMVNTINGKENASDFSACWMLYTSDSEMGNSAWGTCEYQGLTCPSAIVGGDALTVCAGAYYIWDYVTF